MKIGIITQPLLNNYGGLLQNYASQQVLRSLGHEVETLDWQPIKPSATKEWLWERKQTFLRLFNNKIVKPRYLLTEREEAIIGQYTKQFIEKYISVRPHTLHQISDFEALDSECIYDAYVVGSDQVWRPGYNATMMPAMFLSFVKRDSVKRVAYAASFGIANWEFTKEQTEEYSKLANKFDLITVREESGVKLCKDYLGADAFHVLDPTMLLDKEAYESLVLSERESASPGSLFYYILDPNGEKKQLINQVASIKDLIPFTVMPKCQAENRTKQDVKRRIEDCVFPSVTSWLRGFMDAKMVIVDSFHGAVFSIIFNKPFWVISNLSRGNARFESLLKLYGLEERLISTDNVSTTDWSLPIDWERINTKREEERERSIYLLKSSLS